MSHAIARSPRTPKKKATLEETANIRIAVTAIPPEGFQGRTGARSSTRSSIRLFATSLISFTLDKALIFLSPDGYLLSPVIPTGRFLPRLRQCLSPSIFTMAITSACLSGIIPNKRSSSPWRLRPHPVDRNQFFIQFAMLVAIDFAQAVNPAITSDGGEPRQERFGRIIAGPLFVQRD